MLNKFQKEIPKTTFLLTLLLIPILFSTLNMFAQESSYSAILVRGDIPADWVIAESYANEVNIPVLMVAKKGGIDEITKALLSGLCLIGRKNILILGEELAIPKSTELELKKMGFSVERIWGTTRIETSAEVAARLWSKEKTKAVVLVDGYNPTAAFAALSISMEKGTPVLYIKKDELPESTVRVILNYLTEVKEIYILDTNLSNKVLKEVEELGKKTYLVSMNSSYVSPENKTNFEPLLTVISEFIDYRLFLGLSIGALIAFVFLTSFLKQKKIQPIKNFLNTFLTYDEREIFKAVMRKGKITQDDLASIVGLTKPTTSRVISELVMRNILKKERLGKTYLITVSEEVRKLLRG